MPDPFPADSASLEATERHHINTEICTLIYHHRPELEIPQRMENHIDFVGENRSLKAIIR
jgi:hypothetical protein